MADPGIRTRYDNGVVEIILDAPPVNSFSVRFLETLGEAVSSVPATTAAVVVTSAVPGMFAAGGDLRFMAGASAEESDAYVGLCQEVYGLFEQPRFVTLAAIDGYCLGGGLELALACDVRLVTPGAVLGLPEATRGILAGGGAIHRLVRAVG